ncbi:MAG: histone deacetylase [Deltaproteobacteria bacterium]|nr:histone deacetylase [Deltaproteobacteria bacterium]
MSENFNLKTACVFSEAFFDHVAPIDHPECPGRLRAVVKTLKESGLWKGFDFIKPRRVDHEELTLIHQPHYLTAVEQKLMRGVSGYLDLGDTYYSPGTYQAAYEAAGGGIDMVRAIMNGSVENGIALVRPPGHHAETDLAMGFCLFNNIAAAAASIVKDDPTKKVAIVDFDVHHGNGTQNIFYSNPSVLYASIHQSPLFPGTGDIDETGSDKAPGTTINVPMPPLGDDVDWVYALTNLIFPVIRKFNPDIILVSAGYDAHKLDHISSQTLTDRGFSIIHSMLFSLATEICNGKLGVFMEGGYHFDALATGISSFSKILLTGNLNDDIQFENSPAHSTVTTVNKVLTSINSIWNIKLTDDGDSFYELY